MFVAGLVVFTLGSVFSGVSPNVALLISARLVQAIGAGMMVPASLSLLLAAVPGHARAQAIGTWSAIGALGAALGPVIGGFLVELSWRWVFWINIPVGVVAVILALKTLPESRDESATARPDMLGAVLVAVAAGSLALALVQAPSWGWTSKDFFGLLALTIASALGVVVRSARHDAPVVDLKLLESKSFNGAILASIAYYAGFGAFLLGMVEFLTGVWHFSAIDAGLAIAPGPLMVLPFARVVAPRLSAKLGGAGRVAVIGCFVNVAAQSLWLTQIQVHAAYVTHLLPVQLLGGAGVGLTIPSLIGAGTASIPPARFGTGSGVLNMSRQIGTVLGVAGLIAILAGLNVADPVVAFRHGTELVIAFFALAGVTSATLLSRRVTTSA
jgi:EmrB/QacA subfamily drug resistance transporter